jgi:hypothetical protein
MNLLIMELLKSLKVGHNSEICTPNTKNQTVSMFTLMLKNDFYKNNIIILKLNK